MPISLIPRRIGALPPRRRGITLAEVIISVALFVFMAAAICSTMVVGFKTFKSAHLDLVAYNLASDYCGQLQASGYTTFDPKTTTTPPTAQKFTHFDKKTGKMVTVPSATTYEGRTSEGSGLTFGAVNYVDADTDLITGTSRGASVNRDADYEIRTSTFRFAVTPAYTAVTETLTNGLTISYIRVSVTVTYPDTATSRLGAWMSGESHRPVTVASVISAANTGSRYLTY